MADEIRRVRTQAERDADGTTWRATADTRPGYATYPNTPAGDPSWWRRHVSGAEPTLTPGRCGNSTFPLIGGGALICTLAAGHDGGHRDGSGTEWIPVANRSTLISQPPPRRRWWHRYTRRNR